MLIDHNVTMFIEKVLFQMNSQIEIQKTKTLTNSVFSFSLKQAMQLQSTEASWARIKWMINKKTVKCDCAK